MKKIKIQIKSIFGKVLFGYESENNTIKNVLQRKNLGFMGYDWMIDSILKHGKII